MNNRDIYRFRNRLLAEESQGAMCNECGGAMYEGMCMECGYMEEELKGDQHKIDADKDGKITAKDFKMLRAKNEGHEGQDHEVSMANNSLDAILWAANELKKKLGDEERDIPAWIQDHITNAENYILQAAKNFHEYGDSEEDEYEDDFIGTYDDGLEDYDYDEEWNDDYEGGDDYEEYDEESLMESKKRLRRK